MIKKLACLGIAMLSTISASYAESSVSEPYMNDLKRRLKRAWFPPERQTDARVYVVFKVHEDGSMSDLRVEKSSGIALADQCAQKAVENASPFRPLPSDVSSESVDIHITFDRDLYEFNPNRSLPTSGSPSPAIAPTVASVSSEFRFAPDNPYMLDVSRRIKRAWFPPRGNENHLITVSFRVRNNGEMTDLRIQKSSGIPIADQAALKAVSNASPFRPLPPGCPESVPIDFRFDYKSSN